ncbi:MAG: DUF1566 domain-containing protein [Wenzhouxiangellaceae bacterium]
MTSIKFMKSPRRHQCKYICPRLPIGLFGKATVLAAAIGLSGCSEQGERTATAESWQRIDNQGRVVDDQDGLHRCVFDQRTDLLWEVKQTEDGAHRFDATYSWYNEDPTQHMSEPGLLNGGDCDLERCDTSALVVAVNQTGLCGQRDWRIPQREELLTLGDYQLIESGIVLDPEFFPHALPAEYWTASTFRLYPQSAWVVSAANGLDRGERKSEARPARLVRGDIFNPRKPPDASVATE